MVVLGRIDWLLEHLLHGSDVQFSCSFNDAMNRTKLRFTVRLGQDILHTPSPFIYEVLLHLRQYAQTYVCTDAGHKHSSGTSVATFWITHAVSSSLLLHGADGGDGGDVLRRPMQQHAEPENEDDMDTSGGNRHALPQPTAGYQPTGTFVEHKNSFLTMGSVQDDQDKMRTLARPASAPALLGALRCRVVVGNSDVDGPLGADFVDEIGECPAINVEEHIYHICSSFAKIHELLSGLPDSVEEVVLSTPPLQEDASVSSCQVFSNYLAEWKLLRPFSCAMARPVPPDCYEFMLDSSEITSADLKYPVDICIVEVEVHAMPELDVLGPPRSLLAVPGKMPLRIITATSVGHEILGISCKDPHYTESDVLEDDFVAQMASHGLNMFLRSFDGDEDDFCD